MDKNSLHTMLDRVLKYRYVIILVLIAYGLGIASRWITIPVSLGLLISTVIVFQFWRRSRSD